MYPCTCVSVVLCRRVCCKHYPQLLQSKVRDAHVFLQVTRRWVEEVHCIERPSDMQRNIEIKAKLRAWHRDKLIRAARHLSGHHEQVLEQTDVFYGVARGRMKLRMFGGPSSFGAGTAPGDDALECAWYDRPVAGELIWYDRPDTKESKTSTYKRVELPDPHAFEQAMEAGQVLNTIGRVVKRRLLFLIGQSRVHVDCVEDLGDFVEIEVVLRPDQSTEEGQKIAQELMSSLSIDQGDLIDVAYVDLLRAQRDAAKNSNSLIPSDPSAVACKSAVCASTSAQGGVNKHATPTPLLSSFDVRHAARIAADEQHAASHP
jgi:adenylate cyclase class IV